MDDVTRKTFLMYSKLPEFQQLINRTLKGIKRELAGGKCAVAFSGGKDSTVMLHLTLQLCPDIDVSFWDQGVYLMPEEVTNEVISNAYALGVANLIVYTAPVQQDRRIIDSSFLWGVSHRNKYYIIDKLKKEYGWKTQFIGLRSEESSSRRSVCKKPRRGEFYPVADWRWMDIWAYIVRYNLPYPRLYDVYCPRLGWDKARFVNFFTKRFEHLGSTIVDGYFLSGYRYSYMGDEKK